MNTVKLYKSLISDVVYPVLKDHEFRLDKESLFSENEEIITLVGFQKSSKSTKDSFVFTINIGFLVKRISLFKRGSVTQQPEPDDCHWKMRIGFLLDDRKDKWWTLSNEADFSALSGELKGIVAERVLPLLKNYSSVDSFINFWLSGKAQGITDFERMINLSVLLKQAGRTEDLKSVIEQLNNIPNEKPVYLTGQDHIKRLTQ